MHTWLESLEMTFISILVGDDNKNDPGDGEVYAMEMALWDTITNTITLVPHPPGYENLR